MMDPAQQRLADRQAIGDLLVDYCLHLDTMDLDALAALFTHDCDVVYGPGEHLQSRGREALTKSLERMWRWARTSHHLSNLRIRFDGPDCADVISYVIAWHERPDGATATIYGQYRDRLVRSDAGWRIHRRRMFMNGSDAGFNVPIPPLDRRAAPPDWVAPEISPPPE